MSDERQRVNSFGRLEDGLRQASDWYLLGPYVSERQWGTVREDYSADGQAWDYFPHEYARSRAYRWGEDGLAGFCDIEQRLCLGLALWNGRDPILKERIFGLTGGQGNHGEDAKEYWWYLDAVPSHAWNRWRYHYPQSAFPYQALIDENARRGKLDPEYELLDTGAFDQDRYWIVEVRYAKADPRDVLMDIRITNAGPEPDTLHVLPTAWFRNTWAWESIAAKPLMEQVGPGRVRVDHPLFGELEWSGAAAVDGSPPTVLFCENESNDQRLFGAQSGTPWPKDGINDHVIAGAPTVNPERRGTKCAFWYQHTLPPGGTLELRLRLRPSRADRVVDPLGVSFDQVVTGREAEADEFYAELTPPAATADEALVMRQAFAGMLWSKQLYNYNVARWLAGDPAQPPPPVTWLTGCNSRWLNFDAFDIMSMLDKWEYPWFAAWDLAFHCVALAHVDPAFAKYQLILLCRECFDFLSRIFEKLLINFTWWVKRQDADGSNVFEGGFLGLDNIGPLDRSHVPVGGRLEQSDATGWMASYALSMGIMGVLLNRSGQRPCADLVLKFLEHFAGIGSAMEKQAMWDDADGLAYDRLVTSDGSVVPVKVRSMVGVIPMLAAVVLDEPMLQRSLIFGKQFAGLLAHMVYQDPTELQSSGLIRGEFPHRQLLLGVVPQQRLLRLLARLFDPSEFLSPHGLRSISAYHGQHPYVLEVQGTRAIIEYEPAESRTNMFGGNSNWRGPIWLPLNYLLVSVLERYQRFFGDEFTIEYPTGSGHQLPVGDVIDDLLARLISIFLVGLDGRRPCFGGVERMQSDPAWKDNLLFYEYFHGDNGAGLGASHQTGWTGIVADMIRRRHGVTPSLGQMLREAIAPAATPNPGV